MIIDNRIRPPPISGITNLTAESISRRFTFSTPESLKANSTDLFLQEMNEAEINIGIIWARVSTASRHTSSTSEAVFDIVKKYPKRFLGYGVIDPRTTDISMVRSVDHAIKDLGLKGIIIEANLVKPVQSSDDKRFFPAYERCVELGVPILLTLGGYSGEHPRVVEHIASEFPDLDIICAHAGYPMVQNMLSVALKHPRVYIEPDLYLNYYMPNSLDYVYAADSYLQDQLIFGSAYPACGPLRECVENAKKLPFKTRETLDKFLYQNIARLLRVDIEQ